MEVKIPTSCWQMKWCKAANSEIPDHGVRFTGVSASCPAPVTSRKELLSLLRNIYR